MKISVNSGPHMGRVRAYQRVLSMAPWTFAAGLDFRRWAGQATAFRDAERSAVVEGDGDPLGLVDPFVGEPLRQEVSAERPVWTEGGSVFDHSAAATLQTDKINPGTGAATFLAVFREDDLSTGTRINALMNTQLSTDRGGWWFARRDETRVQFQGYNELGDMEYNVVPNLPAGETFLDGEFHCIAHVIDVAGGNVRGYWDGIEILNSPLAVAAPIDGTGGLGIADQRVGLRYWTGPIRTALAVRQALDASTIAKISDLLL